MKETKELENKYVEFLRNYSKHKLSQEGYVVIYVDPVLCVNYALIHGGKIVQNKALDKETPKSSKITIRTFATLYGLNGLKEAVEKILAHENLLQIKAQEHTGFC